MVRHTFATVAFFVVSAPQDTAPGFIVQTSDSRFWSGPLPLPGDCRLCEVYSSACVCTSLGATVIVSPPSPCTSLTGVCLAVADVIVASEGHLHTLTALGSINEMQTQMPLGASVSLAMAPAHDKLYLGDGNHPNASVFRLDVESGQMVPVVPSKSS